MNVFIPLLLYLAFHKVSFMYKVFFFNRLNYYNLIEFLDLELVLSPSKLRHSVMPKLSFHHHDGGGKSVNSLCKRWLNIGIKVWVPPFLVVCAHRSTIRESGWIYIRSGDRFGFANHGIVPIPAAAKVLHVQWQSKRNTDDKEVVTLPSPDVDVGGEYWAQNELARML